MKWRFHPEAAEEYLGACRHYVGVRRELGASFVQHVEAGIERILERPRAWPVVEEDVRRFLLRRFPYYLYYTIEGVQLVLIVAVMHTKRMPGLWRGRVRPG